MNLEVLSPKDVAKTLKVTVQKTGYLGFSAVTAKELSLEKGKYIKFFKDTEEIDKPILIVLDKEDSDAYPLFQGGDYFNVHTTGLFDTLGYKYKEDNIICHLRREPEAEELLHAPAYRLVPQKKRPRKPKEDVAQQC